MTIEPKLLPFMRGEYKCIHDGVTLLFIPQNKMTLRENFIKLCYECGNWLLHEEKIEDFGLVKGRTPFNKEEIKSIIERGFVFME